MATARPPVLLLLFLLLCLCCLHVWAVPENVALGKQTNSSSVYKEWNSSYAVDNNTGQAPYGNGYFCVHTAVGDTASWWWVDLGSVFPMDNIVIYYRKRTLHRFTGATVNIANSSGTETTCATISNTTQYESDAIVRLNCSQSGQRLILRQSGTCSVCNEITCPNCYLEPCEVQVFVCTSGTYGPNCTEQCGHCSDGANCHHVTGFCLSGSCQPGYRGDRCDQVCTKGTYGQNCAGGCGHCSDGAKCHHETGSCLSGSCQPGYRGDRCDQGVDATEAPVQGPAGCQCPPSRSTYMEGLGVGVAIGFAVCLALNAAFLAVFCCARRYRRGPGAKESSTSQRGGDTTQGRDATVYYNVSSTPAAVEGGSPYESLDTATRTENVPNDYVSVGSQDK